ncbi:Zinc-binding alcohol dehydrogenase domain-containing protein cipB [Diplodia seriata]|uniref:Zinc-binding alcohol dehydrogenase domain-containing protein cipB n=1 Tax=Diplodia seriata TaxID=420778 RepID=A0A1S8B3X0_9PEZI|nr:Zinc-binding alcohol dehydrogenase domain-containing protein cipB [Diplodia seriata]
MATTTQPKNEAAWLTSEKAYPLEVKEAPFPEPVDDEIIIKVGAVAVNPVDWFLQETAFYPLSYPWILGTDAAGTVHAVGPDQHAYAVGDRVLALTPGFDTKEASGGAFQRYVKQRPPLVTKLPSNVSFADAAVLPLATGTAAAGLFEKAHMGLRLPFVDAAEKKEDKGEKEVLLVWGAASSVGSCAVQLARAAGYEVWGVASGANAGYTTEALGAARAFDYRDEGVVGKIVAAFEGRRFAGIFDAASVGGAVEACVEIAGRVKAEGRRYVASVRMLPEEVKARLPEGVEANWMWGSMSAKTEVGPAVFERFLPKALEDGRMKCLPRPEVVGEGLGSLQKAFDVLKGGVSAKKLVVTL